MLATLNQDNKARIGWLAAHESHTILVRSKEKILMDTTLNHYQQLSEDYRRIEQAIVYLETRYQRQPELHEIAASIGLSEYHFQRLFTRWVGISPKRFLQFLTKEGAKELLAHSANLLDATYNVGLSSPGRLHDLFVNS